MSHRIKCNLTIVDQRHCTNESIAQTTIGYIKGYSMNIIHPD